MEARVESAKAAPVRRKARSKGNRRKAEYQSGNRGNEVEADKEAERTKEREAESTGKNHREGKPGRRERKKRELE